MKKQAFKIFNYIFFAVISFVMVYPFWYVLLASITPYSEIMNVIFPLIPTRLDFSAYMEIFEKGILTDAYRVTLQATAVGLVFSLLMTIAGAYVLSIRNLPGAKFISMVIILTMFFSGGLIPMYILLSDLKLVNSFWVYIFPYMINTVFMFIIRTSFDEIPRSLREAAEIDGAGEFKILTSVYLPLSRPTILVIGLFYVVDKWNELYTALYFITDYKLYTLQAALYNLLNAASETGIGYNSISHVDEQVKYSAVMLAILPVLLVYPFVQKHFSKGVLMGAVKG